MDLATDVLSTAIIEDVRPGGKARNPGRPYWALARK
jgi:hypothetical protein